MSQANSTRKRNSAQFTERDLPPQRRSKGIRNDVPLPLENTSLRRLIYILVTLTALLGFFYAYRTVQYKKEVGGWWNLVLGRKPPHVTGGSWESPSSSGSKHSVEDKINDLAAALGMPSHELASAIALAVHNYVPPASLSSIAAKETGTVIKVLKEGAESGEADGLNVPQRSPEPTPGVVEEIVNGFETFVGMEEP